MTAYRMVTLTCDACGEIHDSGSARSVRGARSVAHAEGWTYTDGQDRCPRHYGYVMYITEWVHDPDIARKMATEYGWPYYGDKRP